jgi:hypothetical protein
MMDWTNNSGSACMIKALVGRVRSLRRFWTNMPGNSRHAKADRKRFDVLERAKAAATEG